MPKPLRQLTPDLSPAHRLGAELRKLRCARGHSHKSLGEKVHTSKSLIGAIETGERISTAEVIRACDDELGAAGTLVALWIVASRARTKVGRPSKQAIGGLAGTVRSSGDSPLGRALEHVERSWLVQLDWGGVVRGLASIGARTDRGTWVRLEHGQVGEITSPSWGGVEASAALQGVAAPSWISTLTWRGEEPGVVWRADEVELVDEPPMSQDAALYTDPGLPSAWWSTWGNSMQALSEAQIARVARSRQQPVSAQRVARVIEDVWPGRVDTRISEWTCAHGDMTWRKVTGPHCWILGWDGFGLAPRGLDAATLWSNALAVPEVATRIWRERRADLESPTGTVAALFCLARLLRSPRTKHDRLHRLADREASVLMNYTSQAA